jgi:hypothetical protein
MFGHHGPHRPAQRQIDRLTEQKHRGASINRHLQHLRSFMNPVILEKLVDRFQIDEIGSNYPPVLYNPHAVPPLGTTDSNVPTPSGDIRRTASRWDQPR